MPKQNLVTLENNPNDKPQALPPAQLLFHFYVEYEHKHVPYALLPGQLIPVWDLNKWNRIDEFEFHCSSAVRWNETLIAAPGFNHPLEESVHAAAFISGQPGRPDAPRQALLNRLARVPLGNVGGRRVLRPDPLPVGMMPMEARSSYGKRTMETHLMSMLEWAQAVEGMPAATAPLPAFRFYVESKEGELEGFDVRRKKAKTVTAIELPFSICSGEELDILTGSGDSLEREMEMLLSLTQGVRRLANAYGYQGQIYFGYDLPPEGEGLPDVDTKMMTLEHYQSHRAELNEVYEIPFLGDNPFDVLTSAVRIQIQDLLRRRPPVKVTRRVDSTETVAAMV